MNTLKDFHKKESGVVINSNTKDFKRARNRNFTRREVEKQIGEAGKVAQLEQELAELKELLNKVLAGDK